MREYFTEILGNDAQKRRIARAVEDGVFAHAHIIEGPGGSGKRTFATHIAAALSCLNRQNPAKSLPCLECDVCRRITSGLSPDVIYIERGSRASIGVDSARETRGDAFIKPNDTDVKVYIIGEAHTLTAQAQNALLAIIEEPPPGVYFFLLCEDRETLLETVRSRAPVFKMQLLPPEVIGNYLAASDKKAALLKRDNYGEFAAVCAYARGSIGAAAALMDAKKRAAALAARDLAIKTAGLCAPADGGERRKPANAGGGMYSPGVSARANISPGGSAALFGIFSSYPQKGAEAAAVLEQCCLVFRDLLAAQTGEIPPVFAGETDPAIADRFTAAQLIKLYEKFAGAAAALQRNANVSLTLSALAGTAV